MSDPLTVSCPQCHSPAGRPCTMWTNTGRKFIDWAHLARSALADKD